MANLVIPKGVYFDTDNIISVKVPSTVSDGAILVANALTSDKGDDVYNGTAPVANTDDALCIVCGDEFYQDAYGNRINITDPTKIDYQTGSIVRAYRMVKSRRFAISNGAITGTPVVGQFLIPTAGSTTLTASATVPANVKYAFVVEKINTNITYTGLNPLAGVIARVSVGE